MSNTTEYLNNKTFERLIDKFQKATKQKSRNSLLIEDVENTINRRKERDVECAEDKSVLRSLKKDQNEAETNFSESQSELAIAFYTLSENIVRYAKFDLIDQDDAVQEGVMICFDKVYRFDSRKGKAFNYMTTCILNHFRQLYRTARNYNELKKKYLAHVQRKYEKTVIKNGKEVSVYYGAMSSSSKLI